MKLAPNLVALVVAVAVTGYVGFVVADTVTDERFEEYIDGSAEWCEERDGDLYNAQVIGPHGGLHCKLPNGTHVHMSEVVAYGE